MITPHITVDTSHFNKAFKEYLEYSKKDLKEIVNTKAYYIARNAVNTTKAVENPKIEAELHAAARDYPRAPLAAIICAKQQNRTRFSKKTGKQLQDKAGLYGASMTAAINKLITARKRTTNFLRAGWIASIKAIEPFVSKKSGPSYKRVKTAGVNKGGAKGCSKDTWKAVASIWNSVTGGTKKRNLNSQSNPSKVQSILSNGLQLAINKEVASMKQYVQKKVDDRANKFNRS